jgi:hypothetical protein
VLVCGLIWDQQTARSDAAETRDPALHHRPSPMTHSQVRAEHVSPARDPWTAHIWHSTRGLAVRQFDEPDCHFVRVNRLDQEIGTGITGSLAIRCAPLKM